jgi:hypothetical protein
MGKEYEENKNVSTKIKDDRHTTRREKYNFPRPVGKIWIFPSANKVESCCFLSQEQPWTGNSSS